MRRRSLQLGIVTLAAASLCSASYHFIHFNSRTAPWQGIPEKFDVNVLPAKTLPYFITDQSGVQLHPNDTYTGFISQIRAAAKTWSDVESSDLRLAFGGFAAPNAPQSGPSMEIVFEDLAPGLIAAGTPTVRAENNGQFVPILRSVVMIRPDLRNHPSFGESLFGTMVHEIGHGLGLQHTFTSGVMATAITRTTSRAKPLTVDDVAAISLLYPSAAFAGTTGSISGRVTMQGSGVNLASVVAISPSGAAVSTLTNPDGTYRIDGVPPRSYFVYVHPLPPPRQGQTTPGDIVYPRTSDGQELPPSGPFFTIFYPGTNDPSRAVTVNPTPGQVVENVNFSVQSRSGYGIHSVDTRAFPGPSAVKPPYLSPNMTYPFIVATGSGLINGSAPAPGLTVSVLGGATLATKPYSPAPASYMQIDFDVRTLGFFNDSARHLVFSRGGDIYVLPAAFFHVDKAPPAVSAVIPTGDAGQRQAIILGANLSDTSRVYFDGAPAPVREADGLGGRLVVTPPAAAPNHRASVVVLSAEGQSSLFLQGDSPATYTYSGELASLTAPNASVSVTPGLLTAGAESMVQIDVTGGVVLEGQTTVGFGSSDIVVRNIAVVSPTRILANVAVSAAAQSGYAQVSVVSGLQVIAQPFAAQIVPAQRAFWLNTPVSAVSAGSSGTIRVGSSPVGLTGSNFVLYLNDQPVPVLAVDGGQITFQVPSATPTGAAVLRMEAAGERSLPILLMVDSPAPRIVSAAPSSAVDTLASTTAPKVRIGQFMAVTVNHLAPRDTLIETSRVLVKLGNAGLPVAQVLPNGDMHQLLVYVPPTTALGRDVPLSVVFGTRTSEPLSVTVEAGN
ncbi:MAG TPA: matrixin family metalloprotease [Bryobacteraceae bacterium]|nr:matrixin family metalloprotease [Bryobacteraceae bacterium]